MLIPHFDSHISLNPILIRGTFPKPLKVFNSKKIIFEFGKVNKRKDNEEDQLLLKHITS